ncbi:MAG: ATP-binding protein, partial [Betaproteobacteria bacterium AqS2]|nr:ATP-binding protein [Betaproteobacteria bacterium AqS2]
MAKFRKQDNPFRPGTATRPGHLAGREKEQEMLAMALQFIKAKSSPMAPIRIVGPRGVGKSTLLVEAKRMAEEHQIHVVRATKLASLDPDGPLTRNILAGMENKKR